MSKRVLAIVEGHTECAVLKSTIAAHLGGLGVFLHPKIVGRPGHKGGVYRSFDSVAKEIITLFKQEPHAVVTTFFDFYAMPASWPGVAQAKEAKQNGRPTAEIAHEVERAWAEAMSLQTANLEQPAHFIPYVQMHELEALLYAGPKEMAEAFTRPELEQNFAKIVEECGGCENINDRPQFAPSQRIEDIYPSYRKGRDKNKREDRRPHAPIIVQKVGIQRLREACPHFNDWLRCLEELAP
jgi:hypothetical protein